MACGKQQRREAPGVEVRGARRARRASLSGAAQLPDGCRARVDRRAMLEQHARDVRMPVGHGPHQGGLPSRRLRGVDIGAMRQQRADGCRIARVRAPHEQRLARPQPHVGIRAVLEQPFHDPGVPVGACHPQRCGTVVILRVHVRAGPDQSLQRVAFVPVRRPVEGCRTVGLSRIDVQLLAQQDTDGLPLLVLRRVHEPQICTGGAQTDDPRSAQQPHRDSQSSVLECSAHH